MQGATGNIPLWERTVLRDTAGTTLRPGGFTLTDRGLSLASIPAKGSILDVGCGLGATVAHLISRHGFKACGIDNSVRQLTEAPEHLPLTLASADNLAFDNSSFDALICECVLSLMPDMNSTIREFKRVLKYSGKLIISDIYQRTAQSQPVIKGSCATTPLNLSELEASLQQNGMRISSLEDHSRLLVELAAKLIFAGEKGISMSESCCGRPGYMLLIAESDN